MCGCDRPAARAWQAHARSAIVRRLSRIILSLAALLALCGCSSPGDGVIDVTYDLCAPVAIAPAADATPDEIAAIDDAIAMWRRAGVWALARDSRAAALPVHFEVASTAFLGVYEDEAGEIYINRKIADPHARAVTVAHELGHAFGLLHVARDARASVMNTHNTAVEPTAADMAALVERWGSCAEVR